MKHHLFILLANLIFSFTLKADNSTADQAINYQAGIAYEIINPAWSDESEKTVIYEFFSYMCPGCNAFEPQMEKLSEQIGEHQEIVRIPVVFYKQWEPHAKAYHALKLMGEVENVHKALFAAIHQHKKPLRTLEDIGNWLSSTFEIDKQSFLSSAQSFAVDTKMRKSKQMVKAMGIVGVPKLVIDGKYKLDFDQLKTDENIIGATLFLANENTDP